MRNEAEIFAALDRLSRDLGDVKHQLAFVFADKGRTTRRKCIAARNVLNDASRWIARATDMLNKELMSEEKEAVGTDSVKE